MAIPGTEEDFVRFIQSLKTRGREGFKAIHVLATRAVLDKRATLYCLDFNFPMEAHTLAALVAEAEQRAAALAPGVALPAAPPESWRIFWQAPLLGTGYAPFNNALGKAIVIVRGNRRGHEDIAREMYLGRK